MKYIIELNDKPRNDDIVIYKNGKWVAMPVGNITAELKNQVRELDLRLRRLDLLEKQVKELRGED